MKAIIVGCGKVGQKLADKLSREEDLAVTVIDINSAVVQDVTNRFDVYGVVGSGASVDTLEEAGIRPGDILIAVTGSDEFNLLTCLIAKKSCGCQTIARVRKPEYGKEVHLFKEDLGLAMIINPERAAAEVMARCLRFPSAISIDTFAKGRVEILKFRIPIGSPLGSTRIADLSGKFGCDILVCGVERGDAAFIPGGDFVLLEGDLISIVASQQNSSAFFKKAGVKTNPVKDTIIVGGGATGFYLAERLLADGIRVKIIEQNEERCSELSQILPKATIIHGDGTDNGVLLEEGIEYASSFVSLTNIDEENILLSLFARSKSDGKVITKITRIAYDDVIASLDLGTTVYPKEITAEYIVRFVRAKKNSIGSNVETVHFIFEGKAEALEFRIRENSPISGRRIDQLNIKKGILIACINRRGSVIIPRGKDIIETGDTVVVVTNQTGFEDISDILN